MRPTEWFFYWTNICHHPRHPSTVSKMQLLSWPTSRINSTNTQLQTVPTKVPSLWCSLHNTHIFIYATYRCRAPTHGQIGGGGIIHLKIMQSPLKNHSELNRWNMKSGLSPSKAPTIFLIGVAWTRHFKRNSAPDTFMIIL